MFLMSSTNLSSHTGRHNKQFFHSAAGNAKIYLKKLQQYHPVPHTPNGNIHPHIIIHSLFFPPSPLTLFHFLGNFLTSWTLLFLGHFLFLRDLISLLFSGDLLILSYFNSWVSTPPTQLGWSQDAPAWVCRPSSLQHLCFHPPGSTFWSRSRLLPITHAQLITSCPFNLSAGQSCLHFISPLLSNYPPQYPKSHNLGFHQHPLHNTKIKPSQLALNSSPPYNQTISSSQNTMLITDNKHSLPDYT